MPKDSGDFACLGIILANEVIGLIGNIDVIGIIHANVLGRTQFGLFAGAIFPALFASASKNWLDQFLDGPFLSGSNITS